MNRKEEKKKRISFPLKEEGEKQREYRTVFLLFHFIPLFLFLIRSLYLPKFDYLFHWFCLLSSLYLQ